MNSRVVDLAVEEALKSEHKHRIGCVIFKKKNIISSAYNKPSGIINKLHPRYQKWPGSLHAETTAIIKARTNLQNCEMLVVRVSRRGNFLMSLPCSWCMPYIVEVGIKKVTYTDDFGKFKTMRIRK